MRNKNKQIFNGYAEHYRKTHTGNIKKISGTDSSYFAEYKIKELLSYEKNTFLQLLDFGCGDGLSAFFFNQYFPAFKITGIDVSNKSIKQAEKWSELADFVLYNGEKLPFPDHTFDIVFISGVLHHIAKTEQLDVLKEIFRVLKAGGRVYLFEHNPLNPLTRFLVKTCEFDKGVTLLYSCKAIRLLRSAGFAINSVVYTIFFPRIKLFKWFISKESYLKRLPFGGQYYLQAIK